MAREILRDLTLLVASQPTRGVSAGSIEFIHRRTADVRNQGCAVLLTSLKLDEVVSLADRIAVICRGRIVGIVPTDTGHDVLDLMMTGVPLDEAVADSSRSAQKSRTPRQEEQWTHI